jgi:hypothetical protein
MYWNIRRVLVQVRVIRKDDDDDIGQLDSMPCVLQGSTNAAANQTSAQPSLEFDSSLVEPPIHQITEVAWVDDDVEYVGLNDEDAISNTLESEPYNDVDYASLEDELFVEDEWGCETVIHATDLENPKIEVGVTFENRDTFKKAIKQYAIKGEYEVATPYCKATRYRGHCKAERCMWRIDASQL